MNKKKIQSYLKAFKNSHVKPLTLINENDDEFLFCGCYIKKDNLRIPKELKMEIRVELHLNGFYAKVEDRLSDVSSFNYLRQYDSADYYTLLKADNKVYCVNQEYLELFDKDATFEVDVYHGISIVRVKEENEIVGYIPTHSKDFTKAIEIKSYDNKDERVYKFFQ